MSIVGAIGEWLRSLFFDNIGLKLASFVLALLLYAHVVTEQQKEEVLRIPVACSGLADTLALLGKPPTEIDVTFRGKWKDLIRLRLSNSLLRVDLDRAGPGTFRHEITPEEIGERALPPELAKSVEITEVAEPRTIELEVELLAEKRIVVVPKIVGEPAEGWRFEPPALLEPDSVLVRGPRSAVDAADSLETLPVDITEERERIQRQVSVDPGTQPLVPEPRRILVTVRLARAEADSTAAGL
jgi:YbbR domain-containing protein